MSSAPPRPRRGRRAFRVIGSLLAALALLGGVVQLVGVVAHGEQRVTTSYAAGAVDTVVVATEHGSIRVVGSDRDDVTVHVDVSDGLVATTREASIRDGRLVLDGQCPWIGQWWCRADYTVLVPASTNIVARSDDGPVQVTGVDGSVDIRTST